MSLTPDERRFMDWWEQERHKYKRRAMQWWLGLPLGALFSIPILLNFFAGRFWYKRADAVGSSQFNPIVLIVAVILIAGFMGYISRRFKWEQNEARYDEFSMRSDASESTSEERTEQ
jgi:integral membrane sensor domain MASE1